jgi:hypothetical protein
LVKRLGEVRENETCGEKKGELQDSETDEEDTKKDSGDPVMFRDPEFEKHLHGIGPLLRDCPCYRIKLFKLMETLARDSVVFCVLCM